MATHSSVLAWRIPGTEESCWAAVYGVAQSWTGLSMGLETGLKRLSSSSSNSSSSYIAIILLQICDSIVTLPRSKHNV